MNKIDIVQLMIDAVKYATSKEHFMDLNELKQSDLAKLEYVEGPMKYIEGSPDNMYTITVYKSTPHDAFIEARTDEPLYRICKGSPKNTGPWIFFQDE